jgi:hypothetical protein
MRARSASFHNKCHCVLSRGGRAGYSYFSWHPEADPSVLVANLSLVDPGWSDRRIEGGRHVLRELPRLFAGSRGLVNVTEWVSDPGSPTQNRRHRQAGKTTSKLGRKACAETEAGQTGLLIDDLRFSFLEGVT